MSIRSNNMKHQTSIAILSILILFSGCNSTPKTTENTPADLNEARVSAAALEQRQLGEAEQAKDSGNYTQAMSLFREILSKNPTVTTAYLGLGDIYVEMKDYSNAEPNYRRAARLEPRNYDAQYGHGLALQMLKRFVDAVRAYHRALVIRPNSTKANLNLATTYLQMGEPRSAMVFAEKAVEFDPENGSARINLGAVYAQLNMHDKAIDTYRVAMELVDPTPELIMNLVMSLSAAERYHETIDAAKTLLRYEKNANAYERMGHSYFKLKDYNESSKSYRQAVKINPNHWPSWNGVGCNAVNKWLLSKKRDATSKSEAGEALRKSLKLNPNQQNVIQLMTTYRL